MDIKLDNILLDKLFNVKVADLGASLDVSETNGYSDSRRGTELYMAPEVSNLLPSETYDAFKSDVYSLGICLYVMVFGEFPVTEEFDDSTIYETDTIGGITGLKCSLECKNKWKLISTDLQDLFSSILSMDPDERPTISEILECDWLKDAYQEGMAQYVYEEMEQRKQYIFKINNVRF